ncbi:MAG: 5'-nucleotidase C-terminal domain-containing protein [Acetobacteraceae bacterium]|nr:5'-nucleotidase C-terminal domain-containing protein [Acetobacteraceae bacterium]
MSRLVIFHSCEHHASVWPFSAPDGRPVGGLERRAALVRREREGGGAVLLLDSGDVLYGATASAAFGGRADIVGMSAAGYDAMGCGNHDFDLGPAYIRELASLASFPIVSSNVHLAEGGPVLPETALLKTPAGSVLIASVVSEDVFSKFNPPARAQLRWLPPVPALQRLVGGGNAEAPDWVVVITHQTTEDDCRLAAEFPHADVIVGGHVAGFAGLIPPGGSSPVAEYEGPGPIVVKAGRQGRWLGRLEAELLPGRWLRAQAQLIEVSLAIPPDPAVEAALRPFREELDQPVAFLPYTDGNLVRLRRGQAALGGLVAAAVRWHCKCDVALQLVGGVFSAGLKGPIRYQDLVDVIPYRSRVVRFRLTREEVLACLEHGLKQLDALGGTLLQVAGAKVKVDPRRPPGQRVVGLEFEGPPDEDGRYAVAVQEYMARGGAGFRMPPDGQDTGIHPVTCLKEYLRSGPGAPAPPVELVSQPPPPPWSAGEQDSDFLDGHTLL